MLHDSILPLTRAVGDWINSSAPGRFYNDNHICCWHGAVCINETKENDNDILSGKFRVKPLYDSRTTSVAIKNKTAMKFSYCMHFLWWKCMPYMGNAWWRHQMETFSTLLALYAGNSPHKGQWRGALVISLICSRINVWINNRESGDLRSHRAHYDITVMAFQYVIWTWSLFSLIIQSFKVG